MGGPTYDHDMEERMRLAIEALVRIADFRHAKRCESRFVPLSECSCYDKSHQEIAQEALQLLGER